MEPLTTLQAPEGTRSIQVDGVPYPVENGLVQVPADAVASLVNHHGFQVRGEAPRKVLVETTSQVPTAASVDPQKTLGKLRRNGPEEPPAESPAEASTT